MRVPGYTELKPLHSSLLSTLCEGVRELDRTAVVLKHYAQDAARVQQEFDILRRIEARGVPRAIEVAATVDGPVLVLERKPGVPLARLIEAEPLRIEAWLETAIQLAEALACVHEARILHKDITPSNVLLDTRTGDASIVDFGLAADLGAAERSSRTHDEPELSLRYMAPEQTGRMNRGSDARSDLYSLGATLYHALTGQAPFESSDRLELIHAHIARLPPSPSELLPEVPDTLARVVLKLLRKQPEERYQSARGLLADLVACRDQWQRSRAIDPALELGTLEAPDRPRFPTRLFGREREIAALRAAYDRVRSGRLACVWIRGPAGYGKSALVDALPPLLAASGGYLAVGKFDLDRDRPYAAWVAVLESIVHQLLVESDAHLARWRSQLATGLGSVARALVDLVPDLDLLLGEAPAVPRLGPRETQARLSLALRRFLQVCATPEHPLVVFLDDLQWSDPESLVLLEDLVTGEHQAALLVIAAFRGAEPSSEDPLFPLLARIERAIRPFETLELGPLPESAIVDLLGETLRRTPEAVRPLVKWIRSAIGESPLLIRQFVEHLHERALLRFQQPVGWVWNLTELADIDIPENAVALLVAKIDRLEPQVREVLTRASCIHGDFDLERLAELSSHPRSELERALYTLCDASLIVPCRRGFRFLHDRIREAAQSRLPAEERSRLHYEAGRLLLVHLSEQERSERTFEIVEQLNQGLAHMPEEQRLVILDLNLSAGRIALAFGAAATADRYLAVARQLSREEDWSARRAIDLDLHLESAESAFQIAQYDAALAVLDRLDARPLALLERARVAVKRIQVFALTKHPEECARYALALLREFGLRWPLHPSRLRIWSTLLITEWMLRGGRESRMTAATAVPEHWIARMILLEPSGGAMARSDARLPVLSGCLALRYFLRRGYLASPAYAFTAYAVFALPWWNPKRSLRVGRSALEWIEKIPHAARGLRVEMQIHAFVYPWFMPRREALLPLERIAQRAEEVGDREFVYYARLNTYSLLAFAGDRVAVTDERMRQVADAARRATLLWPEEGERIHAAYRPLLVAASDAELEGQVAESDAWIASHPSSADPYIRTHWLFVLCVLGRYDLAFAQSEALGERLFRIVPFVHVADHTFHRGLAAAELALHAGRRSRRRYVRALRESLKQMRRWADSGPDFVHMQTVLEAELARSSSRFEAARKLYQRAAARAREQQFPNHAALIQERHARLLLALRRDSEAELAMREAVALYREWGALPKADALVRELNLTE